MSKIEKHLTNLRSEAIKLNQLLSQEEIKAEKVISIIRAAIVGLSLFLSILEVIDSETLGIGFLVPYIVLIILAFFFLIEVYYISSKHDLKFLQHIYKYFAITADITTVTIVMVHFYTERMSAETLSTVTTIQDLGGSYVLFIFVLQIVNLFRFNTYSSIYLGLLGAVGYFAFYNSIFNGGVFKFDSNMSSDSIYNIPVIIFVTILASLVSSFFRKVIIRSKKQEKLERFLPDVVAKEVLAGDRSVEVGGKKEHVTIMFSDIRNFTSISEKKEPEEVVNLLNSYFNDMINVIFKYNGSLDKIVGDGIMALFGVPFSDEDNETSAVLAAKDMLVKLDDFNRIRKLQGEEEIEIGIGIHTGEAIIGNLGCEQRMDFTAIGDAVNTASRLQDLTKKVEPSIVISKSVQDKLPIELAGMALGRARLKGKKEPVAVYGIS